jgi:regulator-associated protein of mTOR
LQHLLYWHYVKVSLAVLLTGELVVQSCQVDLVKDGGHQYFIKFLESPDNIHPEQRAMAAFVLAVIVDEHPPGQLACIQGGLVGICLMHIQAAPSGSEGQPEPLLIQWLCLCLGKLWDGVSDGVTLALQDNAPSILGHLLSEPQPEVIKFTVKHLNWTSLSIVISYVS